MPTVDVMGHIAYNRMGYYRFSTESDLSAVLSCISHIGTVAVSRKANIYRFRNFSEHRFMLLFSETSIRHIFRRTGELTKAVYIDNSNFGIRRLQDKLGGSLVAFGIEAYGRIEEAMQRIESAPAAVVVLRLKSSATEAQRLITTFRDIQESKPNQTSVLVCYLQQPIKMEGCDAIFSTCSDAQRTLRILICAHVLYHNRDLLKTALNATSF